MNSPVLSALCLAHHPRWIEISYAKGWIRAVCSNCGEGKNYRVNKEPVTCPNCGAKMDEAEE